MKAFELVDELRKLMSRDGMGGQSVVIIVDGTDGLSIKGIRWSEETEWFEIHA